MTQSNFAHSHTNVLDQDWYKADSTNYSTQEEEEYFLQIEAKQAKDIATETALCSDDRPCGEVHEFCQDAYCDDCPNEPKLYFTPEGFATIDPTVGAKHDSDKPRMDLIPPHAELLLAQVLTYGANKYAPDNWRKVDNASQRYLAAALRHINSHRQGEVLDPESDLPHLAHAMCSIAFILELDYD